MAGRALHVRTLSSRQVGSVRSATPHTSAILPLLNYCITVRWAFGPSIYKHPPQSERASSQSKDCLIRALILHMLVGGGSGALQGKCGRHAFSGASAAYNHSSISDVPCWVARYPLRAPSLPWVRAFARANC